MQVPSRLVQGDEPIWNFLLSKPVDIRMHAIKPHDNILKRSRYPGIFVHVNRITGHYLIIHSDNFWKLGGAQYRAIQETVQLNAFTEDSAIGGPKGYSAT